MSTYRNGAGPELYYNESIAGTALATFTAEASLMGGYPIPLIPATFFSRLGEESSGMKIIAYGNMSDTSTAPTFTISARLLTSAVTWSAGLLLGSSTTMTMTAISLTNAVWKWETDTTLKALAAGAATSTLSTFGTVSGTAVDGTVPATNVSADIATFDASGATTYYLWFSAACGTSNAANSIRLQNLKVYLEN